MNKRRHALCEEGVHSDVLNQAVDRKGGSYVETSLTKVSLLYCLTVDGGKC